VTEAERLQKALDIAYAYINPRDRTVQEVRLRLQRRGVSEELTETALRTLADQGFLDDARFARLFVADKRRLEQWGSERIRRGLLTRGVGRELTEEALAEQAPAEESFAAGGVPAGAGEDPESELDRALAVLRRRFPEPPQERRERNRALGLLLRKGYESELALDALSAYARGD
jgi:regulatory protein